MRQRFNYLRQTLLPVQGELKWKLSKQQQISQSNSVCIEAVQQSLSESQA